MSEHEDTDETDISIAGLVERQRQLEDRVEELEETVEKKDERIEELESLIEFKGPRGDPKNLWIGSHPIGKMARTGVEKTIELDERVSDIERGEVDPGEVVANMNGGVDPSDLLPLHNMYLSATNLEPDEHDMTKNQELAARLFPYLGQYAYTNEGRMLLPSTKIKDIIEREIATPELAQRLDVDNPNANTIRRVMRFIGKYGKEMMKFDDSQKTNRIEIDRECWVEYKNEISDVATSRDYDGVNTTDDAVNAENTAEEGVEEEMDRLTNGVITVS